MMAASKTTYLIARETRSQRKRRLKKTKNGQKSEIVAKTQLRERGQDSQSSRSRLENRSRVHTRASSRRKQIELAVKVHLGSGPLGCANCEGGGQARIDGLS